MACHVARNYLLSSVTRRLNHSVVCRSQQLANISAGVTEAVGSSLLGPGASSPLPLENRVLSDKVQRLVDEITSLTLLEVADLNYALKKKLNIPDVPVFSPYGSGLGVAQAVSATNTASAEPLEEEANKPATKTSFSIKLAKFDDAKKIALIKEIRNVVSGLNLVQAKKFVDSIPAVVKEDLSKQEAEELKEKLEKAGATCEIV